MLRASRMNGFRLLQERLRAEGWFVEWGMVCCQSCAWSDIPFEHEAGPFEGQEVDFDKVLFNHEQDCQVDCLVECESCDGEGYLAENDDDCPECDGEGLVNDDNLMGDAVWGETMYIDTPENQDNSMFGFSGGKEGVENLKSVLHIIEESGCTFGWDQTGKNRIDISWRDK